MTTLVGISGWTYQGWRGNFYPPKLSHKKELSFASHHFNTIEINGTFYGLQRPTSYQKWFEETPDHFVFSVKGNRYITHIKRLHEIEEGLANFFASGPLELKHKLGPFLWQFPPSLTFDPDRFKRFFEILPKNFKEARKLIRRSDFYSKKGLYSLEENHSLRHAVEIRNQSFLNPWFIELLREHGIALVFADTAGKWPYMEDITSDFLYLRLHGDSELYVSGYDDPTLNFWAKRIKVWREGRAPRDQLTITNDKVNIIPRDVYVYFDNDAKVRAPVDAKSLFEKLS